MILRFRQVFISKSSPIRGRTIVVPAAIGRSGFFHANSPHHCDSSSLSFGILFSNFATAQKPMKSMHTTSLKSAQAYIKPAVRYIQLNTDVSFLISNTEVIVDDGQEHGWD